MMLYSFGHPMQLCCTLLYSRVGSIEAIFPPHSFVDQAGEIFFANFVSCVLEIFAYNLAVCLRPVQCFVSNLCVLVQHVKGGRA